MEPTIRSTTFDSENKSFRITYDTGVVKIVNHEDLYRIEWSLSGPVIVNVWTWKDTLNNKNEYLKTRDLPEVYTFGIAKQLVTTWYKHRASTIDALTEETYFKMKAIGKSDFDEHEKKQLDDIKLPQLPLVTINNEDQEGE